MMRILQSPWLAAVIGALAFLGTTAWALRPGQFQVGSGPTPRGAPPRNEPLGPSWTYKNPEIDQLVAQLHAEREALRIRGKELSDLAARLDLERREIGTITQRVARAQSEMDRTFVRIKEEESANLKKLAKVYATMAPESASKIFVEFQDEAAVKILAFMKDSETAPILESMAKTGTLAARRVALISDRLRLLNAPTPTPDRPKTP